jgi:hypothetical protein
MAAKKKGLYANIAAKRKRIEAGSGEKMRKPGTKGAPTDAAFKAAAKTAKKPKKRLAATFTSTTANPPPKSVCESQK